MKQKKLKQILKLYLLNSRTYENICIKSTDSNLLTNLNLIQIISNLKKAFYTIFKYHKVHKKILFVGLPPKLTFKINKLTPHTATGLSLELQGVTANNFKNILLSKVFSKPLKVKLSKKPDLVVLLSNEKKQNTIVKFSIAKIPVIKFISTSNKNLFFFGLNFLFKRIK